jgi:hypothetical protein
MRSEVIAYRKAILAAVLILITCLSATGQDAAAQPAAPVPLSVRIDRLLVPEIEQLAATEAEAGQSLRRLSLDLRGVVPTLEELDAFEADTSADRWSIWVDKFLADPLCDEHLVNFFDRTLMLRRAYTQVDRAAWINYLREQVAADAAIDTLTKQLLYSPWWNLDQRNAQRFFLDRGGDPNLITRDLGRVLLGRDMQCAQCHDHPLVDDYKQIDYHGLLAYVSTSGLTEVTYKDAEGKDQKAQLYVERAAGDAPFESVFDKGVPFRSGPRLIEQAEQFEEYQMPDARYVAEAPAGSLAGPAVPPKVSRRQALADQLATRSNRAFVANWANRFWSLAFGQGLVQPLDMHHPNNPPSHPQLFALITDGMLESDMRPRSFLKQLTLSQAYRRGGQTRLDALVATSAFNNTDSQLASVRATATSKLADEKSREAKLVEAESATLKAYESAREAWLAVQGERAKIRAEMDAAEAVMLASKKKSTDAAVLLAAAEKRQADTASRIGLLDESAAKLQQAANLTGGEDVELKQAIAVAKQRADVARGTLPEVEKAVADTKAAADATAPELAATTGKVQEIVAKLQPIHQALLATDTAMVASRAQWSEACKALKVNRNAMLQHENVIAWLDGLEDSARLAGELAPANQAVAAIEAEILGVNELIAAAQSQLFAAQAAEQTAASEVTKATEVLARHVADIAQLQQSLEALAASAKLLSTTEPLAAAQTTITTELEARRNQMGAMQTTLDAAKQAVVAAGASAAARAQEFTNLKSNRKAIDDRIAAARATVAAKDAAVSAAKTAVNEKWVAINGDASRQLATATLQALSPEQMCWSTLRVTGVLDAYIRSEAAELEKQSPLAADADTATKAARHRQAVRGAYDKLRGNADVYVSLYASGPDKTEDDFFASADQALYTANAGSVFAWAGPGNNNVTQQAIALTDNAEIARIIYWSLLARQPSAEEIKLVNDQLVTSGDGRNTVIQEMVWGLLASAEFRFVN